MGIYKAETFFHITALVLFLICAEISSCCEMGKEYADACVDTIKAEDCEFMRDFDWCEEDIKFLKGKCDYTCGWCSEDDDCVDSASYIKCSEVTQEECITCPEYYSSRCRKSCNWCKGMPDGLWKEWSAWTRCSATCDPGFQIRSRHCLSRNCRGDSSEVKVCMVKRCPHWSEWGAWSDCSVTCDKGTKTRTRTCPVNDRCPGQAEDVTRCQAPPCFIGGVIFGEWTPCSRSCGGGTSMKVTFCKANDPKQCPKEYRDCNTHPCEHKSCKSYRYGSDKTACCEDIDGEKCFRATQRIFGGKISKPMQFAWMARIEKVGGVAGPKARRLLCGGTLIHEEFVLTAAHCLENVTPDQLQVLFGAISKDETSTLTQRKEVADFVLHPDYSEPENDLAIMRLKTKVSLTKFVTTLCLPEGEESGVDTHCFVAGWGLTDSALIRSSPNLREARLRILPFGVCHQGHRATSYGPHLNETTMICAGEVSGGVDTCRGDSGGPIMCQRCSSCDWYLAGVTSFGSEICGIAHAPGVYMRMSHYEVWAVRYVEQFYKFGLVCKK